MKEQLLIRVDGSSSFRSPVRRHSESTFHNKPSTPPAGVYRRSLKRHSVGSRPKSAPKHTPKISHLINRFRNAPPMSREERKQSEHQEENAIWNSATSVRIKRKSRSKSAGTSKKLRKGWLSVESTKPGSSHGSRSNKSNPEPMRSSSPNLSKSLMKSYGKSPDQNLRRKSIDASLTMSQIRGNLRFSGEINSSTDYKAVKENIKKLFKDSSLTEKDLFSPPKRRKSVKKKKSIRRYQITQASQDRKHEKTPSNQMQYHQTYHTSFSPKRLSLPRNISRKSSRSPGSGKIGSSPKYRRSIDLGIINSPTNSISRQLSFDNMEADKNSTERSSNSESPNRVKPRRYSNNFQITAPKSKLTSIENTDLTKDLFSKIPQKNPEDPLLTKCITESTAETINFVFSNSKLKSFFKFTIEDVSVTNFPDISNAETILNPKKKTKSKSTINSFNDNLQDDPLLNMLKDRVEIVRHQILQQYEEDE